MSHSIQTDGPGGGDKNTASSASNTSSAKTAWQFGLSTLERFGVVIAFIALFTYNAITQPETFLKPENLRNLLNQNADIGVIAVGMTLVIIAGGIDLSVGAVMAFGAAVGLITMNALFEGSMNETLAVIAEGGEIRAADGLTALQTLGRGGLEIPGVLDYYEQPVIFYWNILIFFAVVIAGQLLLGRTRLGRHFIAVGSNEVAARYSGIAVNRVRTWSYVLVGACAGIAALMSLMRMNSVSSSGVGHLAELDAIAAVVIGGTAMTGGRGRVWGTMLGVLILIMISNMLTLADVEVYWQGFVKGVIIILAVLIQRGKAN